MSQWVELTGMEGAAGTLRRVEHAAYIGGAGGGGCGGRSQRCAGGVGGGDSPALGLAVGDAAVADLPGLVLQRCWVSHGAGPRRRRTDPRRFQRTGVPLHLETGGGGVNTVVKLSQRNEPEAWSSYRGPVT